ncbi:MAG: hypothetical protein L3K03_08280 [Thermoplasmata archaeon]|nr:hypothetical protein [Thermoplasmata archaeon]
MPFQPLTDDEFRQFVKAGVAIPGQQGNSLYVAKWSQGPGVEPTKFLAALKAQGSKLEVRNYKGDVNIRVIRLAPTATHGGPAPKQSR